MPHSPAVEPSVSSSSAPPVLRRVVIGCGGDERSRDAVRLGTALARAAGAELHLVLVVKADDPFTIPYPPVGSIDGIIAEQAAGWLGEAETLVDEDVEVHSSIRGGASVAEGLIAAVEELAADLLVTGSGVGAGGVTTHPAVEALLHSAPVPLALAPRGWRDEGGLTEVIAAVSEQHAAHQVADDAAAWAGQLDAGLAHVTFSSDPAARQSSSSGPQEEGVRRIVAAGRTLGRAVRDVDWPSGGVLMIGSSPLARRRRLFLGATAARILTHLPIPMIVMPRRDAETPTSPAGSTR